MTKRPLNRCRDCGRTWYPRGSNLSLECPACGSTSVAIDYTQLLIGGGCLGLLLLVFVCGGIFGPRPGPKPDQKSDTAAAVKEKAADPTPGPASAPAPPAKDVFEGVLAEFRSDARVAERKYKGRTVTATGVVDSADWVDKKSKGPHAILTVGGPKTVVTTFHGRAQVDDVLALKKGQRARVRGKLLSGSYSAATGELLVALDDCELLSPLKGKPEPPKSEPPRPEPPAVALEIAPPPRRATNVPANITNALWVRRRFTEARLIGLSVARPILSDKDKDKDDYFPEALLLLRVETRRLAGARPVDLGRWAGDLGTRRTCSPTAANSSRDGSRESTSSVRSRTARP